MKKLIILGIALLTLLIIGLLFLNGRGKINDDNIIDVNYSGSGDNEREAFYKVPELGIKFPINEKYKNDLTYSFNTSEKYKRKAAAFSLKSIENNGEICSSERGPLGAIFRVEGEFKSGDMLYGCIGGYLVKQFDGFFVCASGPQAPSGCFKGLEDDTLDIGNYMKLSEMERI